MNTTLEKTKFFENTANNIDFANMVRNNNTLKSIFKKSENLKEFFQTCLDEENKNKNFYMWVSKHFFGHKERVARLFSEHGAITTISDMASVLIYNEHAELFIKNSSKSDGTNTVAVFEKDDTCNLIDFMKKTDVLIRGKYAISANDCKQEPTKFELSGFYEVFTASIENKEFIAFKKIAE